MTMAIAAIWQEVLGVDQVGVNDDFFALGGHSLAAVQIGTKIRGRFGVELDLRDFFEGPTVAETATVLAAARHQVRGDHKAGLDSIPARGPDEPGEDQDAVDDLSDEEVEARLQELLGSELKMQGDPA